MVNRLNTSANIALDAQSLDRLRAQAKQSPDQALKAAAQQFESVFLNMMLKSMREATPQDGVFDSEQTKMFTGMLDQQLAQGMASRGVGLADIMVKQLRGQMAADSGQKIGPQSSTSDPRSLMGALPPAYSEMGLAGMGEFPPNSQNAQQEFVNRMLPHAMQASQASGVPPQLMLGQAALESGWGKREIRMADGSNSYNLFGIKANADWNGKVAEVMTTEYKNGVPSKQVEKFRAYSSYAEAFKDYASMLGNNPRYANVLQQGGDAAGMAQALQKAGYATDPKYADKLVSVMDRINLTV
ncbi:MAG: flagellar assembly peptidoglycan hydrolase FlgJ [Gallionella sp.]|nr:flagellar assembly peptidoglycan hydrolase FlgJ [Gallionella sp.]